MTAYRERKVPTPHRDPNRKSHHKRPATTEQLKAARHVVVNDTASCRDACPSCGAPITYTTNGEGGLLAWDHHGGTVHRHQPPPPDRKANRDRVHAFHPVPIPVRRQ